MKIVFGAIAAEKTKRTGRGRYEFVFEVSQPEIHQEAKTMQFKVRSDTDNEHLACDPAIRLAFRAGMEMGKFEVKALSMRDRETWVKSHYRNIVVPTTLTDSRGKKIRLRVSKTVLRVLIAGHHRNA